MQPSRRFRSEKFGRALLFSQQPEHKRQTWGQRGPRKKEGEKALVFEKGKIEISRMEKNNILVLRISLLPTHLGRRESQVDWSKALIRLLNQIVESSSLPNSMTIMRDSRYQKKKLFVLLYDRNTHVPFLFLSFAHTEDIL